MSEDTANTHSDGGLSRRSLLTGSTALVAAAAAIGAQSQAVAQAQAPAQAPAASPRKPPNILVIFGDDIGIPQISAYTMGLMGYRTPNIDRIAAEGAIFTDSYGQQSCTAGRASFILGQEPFRTGLLTIGMPGDPHGIADWMPTIADVMKTRGYATGQFGKNHLGDQDSTCRPSTASTSSSATCTTSMPRRSRKATSTRRIRTSGRQYGPRGVITLQCRRQASRTPGRSTTKRMETVDEEFLAAAKDFIDRQHRADKPFFVWFNATRMHVFTHLKPESRRQDRQGHPCRRHGRA